MRVKGVSPVTAKRMATSGLPLKVHRDKDFGLDGHDEIARARVIHTALTGIDREERDVNLLRGNWRDAVVNARSAASISVMEDSSRQCQRFKSPAWKSVMPAKRTRKETPSSVEP